VIGRRAGTAPGRVLAVTHYDTKALPGARFVGANDGASGVAVLLEVARQLGARPLAHETWLVFFDGEEAFGPTITADDGLYGSRALAKRMADDGSLAEVRALVLVDMVADADLILTPDLGDAPRLAGLLREVARERGLEAALDPRAALPIVDDHTPFAEAGVDTLALIDFQFGARRTPGPLWHTARDDLAAVSEASLNTSGQLAIGVLGRLLLGGSGAGARAAAAL
jgi:Zn-dependent M28 family amino/carboxypeptidase